MVKNQSGQVLLIVLLALAVATTIGLGIIGRSSTDVSISNRIEESARAFSAAEAGVERALSEGQDIPQGTVLTQGVTYQVNVTTQGGLGTYQFPQKSQVNNVETLWLAPHLPTGFVDTDPANDYSGSSLDICWTNESTVPALYVSIYYLTGGNYQTYRSVWDPSPAASGRPIPNATGASGPGGGCNVTGETNLYSATLSLAGFAAGDTLLAMRLQPIFSDTQIYVNPDAALPLQGTRVESIGETATGVTRKIVAFQEYKTPPVIFDSVIYTPGSFEQ